MADRFHVPLPVYCEGTLVLRARRQETEISIGNLMQAVWAAGAETVVPSVLSIRPSKKLCATVARVEWQYQNAAGNTVSSSEINYYCGMDARNEMKIVMVEYIRIGVPQAIRNFYEVKAASTPLN